MISRFTKLVLALSLMLTLSPMSHADPSKLPQEVEVNGVSFVLIPEGWFYKTGGIPRENEDFRYRDGWGGGNVKLWQDSFYIAKHEARASDLVKFLNSDKGSEFYYDGGEANCAITKSFFGQYQLIHPQKDLPATHLSWEQANSWAEWMGFRLPSEAEWEKAARGTDQRIWPWGDQYPDDTYAGFLTASLCFTWPVDSFKKGLSPYGVYNMAGNVREYVADWYNMEFDKSLSDGDTSPALADKGFIDPTHRDEGPFKILKGGRWASKAGQLMIGARIYYRPDVNFRCNGTRFALDTQAVERYLSDGKATIVRN